MSGLDINSRQTDGRHHGFLSPSASGCMDWADLFERATDHETTVETVRARLATRRGEADDG